MTEQLVVVLLLLVNLRMFSSSRMDSLIRNVGMQALLLVCLAGFSLGRGTPWSGWAFLAFTGVVKCIFLPVLMFWALRSVGIRREVEPLVGYRVSLLLGLTATGFSVWVSLHVPLPGGVRDPLALSAALISMITGLFLIVARRKAITQAIGYLAMENGIYVLGPALAVHNPLLVEAGILLDVFVGIYVMGVIMLHIRREFDHIDVDRLSQLKD